MSVIFKTLKKLKTESAGKKDGKNKLMGRKRIFFYNNSLYSPYAVLFMLLILTVIGSGTLYGYYYLRGKKGQNTKVFPVSEIDIGKSSGSSTSKSSEIKGSRSLNQEKRIELDSIEYLPSQENDSKVEVYSSSKTENNKLALISDKNRTSKTGETIEKNMTSDNKTEDSNNSTTKEVSAVREMENIFLENSEKNAKISRLIADIHWEMEHGSNKQTEKLLDELNTLKGQDNSYVLKLKAVWYMHNKEFEQAEDLLKRVLLKNEDDQEAGINMAIIEIKTQHIQKAYERLKNLREMYPENTRIAEIIQNIKSWLNKTQTRHLIRYDKS